jgi:hypothetical protein
MQFVPVRKYLRGVGKRFLLSCSSACASRSSYISVRTVMISSACGKRWFGSALANSRFVVANTAARYEVRTDVRWWLVLTTFIVVLGQSLYALS